MEQHKTKYRIGAKLANGEPAHSKPHNRRRASDPQGIEYLHTTAQRVFK